MYTYHCISVIILGWGSIACLQSKSHSDCYMFKKKKKALKFVVILHAFKLLPSLLSCFGLLCVCFLILFGLGLSSRKLRKLGFTVQEGVLFSEGRAWGRSNLDASAPCCS